MSTRIICTTDHEPSGAKAGALVAIHLDGCGDLDKRLAQLRAEYPGCTIQAKEQDA